MIVFLLCLIVAILLFGSSKVLGAFGKALGFIVFAIGLIFLSNLTGFDALDILGVIFILFVLVCGYFAIMHPEEWKAADDLRKFSENKKRENKN